MKYSLVNFNGNLLPAVWTCEADTEEGALQEALQMHLSRLSTVPALIIDWEANHVKRIIIDYMGKSIGTIDNANELFGIATTAEYFEKIADARDAAEIEERP